MKMEFVDVVCVAVALFFLAAYLKLQNIVFLLIAIILLAGVAFFQIRDIVKIGVKKESPAPVQ